MRHRLTAASSVYSVSLNPTVLQEKKLKLTIASFFFSSSLLLISYHFQYDLVELGCRICSLPFDWGGGFYFYSMFFTLIILTLNTPLVISMWIY